VLSLARDVFKTRAPLGTASLTDAGGNLYAVLEHVKGIADEARAPILTSVAMNLLYFAIGRSDWKQHVDAVVKTTGDASQENSLKFCKPVEGVLIKQEHFDDAQTHVATLRNSPA
jgi:hypothetical protein